MKSKYTLVLTKEDAPIFNREENLSEVMHLVDVVWTGVCTREAAQKKFHDLIEKQVYEYHTLKTITKWRVIRLYDADGQLIMQES